MGKGTGSARQRNVPLQEEVKDEAMIWREEQGVSKRCKLHPKTPSKLTGSLQQYTMAEVAEHNKREDCWIILDERVYGIIKFVDRHPGGVGPCVCVCVCACCVLCVVC